VLHHAVVTYMVELLTKCLKQSEPNAPLFESVVQYLDVLDEADPAVVANLPLHFALYLAGELGFRPENNYSSQQDIFDLREGKFVSEGPYGPDAVVDNGARLTHELLSHPQAITLYRIRMTREQRQELLKAYEHFFMIHVDGFGSLKSLDVLRQIF
jgi:DNA repair protein RecO (recombination protein O)